MEKIEQALAIVANRSKKEKMGVTLQKAELELKVASKKSAKIGGKIEFGVSIDASAEKEWSKAHTLTLALTPKAKVELGKEKESQTLADTIVELAAAMSSISKAAAGNFNASEASVSIEVEEAMD